MIYRIYVEKKDGFDVLTKKLKSEIKDLLSVSLSDLKEFIRYDIEEISESDLKKAVFEVFSDPLCDNVYYENLPEYKNYKMLITEFIPGQYDQRADATAQCLQFLTLKERPIVKCAKVYAVKGCSDSELNKIKNYLINPLETRETGSDKPKTLKQDEIHANDVNILFGFTNFSDEAIKDYHKKNNFAMTVSDLIYVRDYFKTEKRDPFETELKVIDTYWSDHCRHTTFLTELTDIEIDSKNPHIAKTYAEYKELFKEINGAKKDKYLCLMDIATIGAKKLKKDGFLNDLDESEEINACSINAKVDVDGKDTDYLILFKNETHNHPTEMEPFGGAGTCLGGGIRDPLSGRSYVFQSMRFTGSADPNTPFEKTLEGKLPQRVITTTAAKGYSCYGNQVGATTGQVTEIYHENYVAKRMEGGFLVAAAEKKNVVRIKPQKGDVVILVGGETGRDGIGGATGSSKAHVSESSQICAAEVQKGDPLTGRKLIRLFKNKNAAALIKKCNDFGAGGVSVAIGELADSLEISLDKVPVKYSGLSGTELAISESQERMAVVVGKDDAAKFIKYASEENLDATIVAEVTDTGRLIMKFRGKIIVNISREFLNTSGVRQKTKAKISEDICSYHTKINAKTKELLDKNKIKQACLHEISRLNVCSQKGMVEYFDSTIGAGTLFMPLGGKKQLTPAISMAAKIPVNGETNKCALSAFGYNPYLMENSPFVGSMYSVLLSLSKIAASGGNTINARLTFQEYFKRLKDDPARWGAPLSALLGALKVQLALKNPSIGGKDSMSGTFNDIDVPNALISFAICLTDSRGLISNVLTDSDVKLYKLSLKKDEFNVPDLDYAKKLFECVYKNIQSKNIYFATVIEEGGSFAAVVKSCLGNGLGFDFTEKAAELFKPNFAEIIIACKDTAALKNLEILEIGSTNNSGKIKIENAEISLAEMEENFTKTLSSVFKITAESQDKAVSAVSKTSANITSPVKFAKPKVLVPVFIGTNGEFDVENAFRKAGANVKECLILNRTPKDIENSIKEFAKQIKESQIIALAGGFSGGDIPDGSGKFIAAILSNPMVSDSIKEFLTKKGLILGVDNGFKALLKLGLLTSGKIIDSDENTPLLTLNNIGRHVSTIANIKVVNNFSPWLSACNIGSVYSVPISSGEGRFTCKDKALKDLAKTGQIATQFVDFNGNPTMAYPLNPTGSVNAVEGLTSFDGLIFGKIGHSERTNGNLYKNYHGSFDMKIFESGVKYFK